nr:EOG090X0P1V [Lepidurus arcticus]
MEYEAAVKSSLKLKGVSDHTIKKKNKKSKNKDNSKVSSTNKGSDSEQQKEKTPHAPKVKFEKTKAQIKFEQMRDQAQKTKIMERAAKTHKQRVEEFNRHLDSLTEHFDIPKVSWTK